MYVLLPAMLGPVMSRITPASGAVTSLGTNVPSASVTSSTGCRPSTIVQHRFVHHLRAAIVALPRELGERREHVEFRERRGGRLQSRRAAATVIAQREK
jgi:hypothetical protein